MNILALETSTEFCSVALALNGDIFHQEQHVGNMHSELILSMIDDLLKKSNLSPQQINGIAFGEGPGSFTGLRIACGVAQGLAFAINIPVVGVSTLKAVAARAKSAKVVVALDARMGEIYHAAFEQLNDEEWSTVHSGSLCTPENAPLLTNSGWIGCGSGFAIFQDELCKRYGESVCEIRSELYPRAKEIAELALPIFMRGEGFPASGAIPCYIRNKVALKESER